MWVCGAEYDGRPHVSEPRKHAPAYHLIVDRFKSIVRCFQSMCCDNSQKHECGGWTNSNATGSRGSFGLSSNERQAATEHLLRHAKLRVRYTFCTRDWLLLCVKRCIIGYAAAAACTGAKTRIKECTRYVILHWSTLH
jgi:hypothetical protein